MNPGVYDIDGTCVNCRQCHPCNCEIDSYDGEPANGQYPFM